MAHGDVITEAADVRVNTANSGLKHDGGVSLQFCKRGGAAIVQDTQQWLNRYGKVPIGGCAVTSAGSLPNTRYLIHVVGPEWKQNQIQQEQCKQHLKNCVYNVLDAAS